MTARITELKIETEHLSAKVMVDNDDEREYVLGWKAGTSMMRMTEDELLKLKSEIGDIEYTACMTLMVSQPNAMERALNKALESA